MNPQFRFLRESRLFKLFGLAVFAIFLCGPHIAYAAVPGLHATLPRLLDFYTQRSSVNWPAVLPQDISELIAGKAVIKMSGQTAADNDEELVGMGVYGLQIVEAPRLLIWLAIMGGNDERDYRLTPATLSRGQAGSYVRYQHVNLPWPVADRHWVIQCDKNVQLAAESVDEVWEHRWLLRGDGKDLLATAFDAGQITKLKSEVLENAVYLPRNSGAWALIELAKNRTLVIAYVDADLGGRFPRPLVRRFTRSKLKAGLASLQELSSRVHLNYSTDRQIHDGHGKPITKGEALGAASGWSGALQIATRN